MFEGYVVAALACYGLGFALILCKVSKQTKEKDWFQSGSISFAPDGG
jgi:hypothetical protein